MTDADRLAELLELHRDHLGDSRPQEDPTTPREKLEHALAEQAAGRLWPGVIELDGDVVGRINLHNIQLGGQRSAFVSYWLAGDVTGRGIATQALADVLDLAFDDLTLHRVDAFVRPDNLASQTVLRRNGFEEIGLAHHHTHVGGRWHDELLMQRLAPWDDGVTLQPSF